MSRPACQINPNSWPAQTGRRQELVAGKRIRMARIMGGVVNNVDMREAHHADSENAEHDGESRLQNDAGLGG
jgi:hypothetical protein